MNTKVLNPNTKTIEKQPLLMEAFEALLARLGPEKTARVWTILTAPSGDYLSVRPKLFAGKDIDAICHEAEHFNRQQTK